MIKFEHTEVIGWRAAIRGMRNPLNSWEKSDSANICLLRYNDDGCTKCGSCMCDPIIGYNDRDLMQRLRNAGTDHRKFMRMLIVYVDITAPLYWWKEFDTYKVGTVANSCSTMHTIHKKEFTLDDFSCEQLMDDDDITSYGAEWLTPRDILQITIDTLNGARKMYLETKDKKYWWQMIQLLPTSYNQKRTVMLNYEVLANIYKSRKDHKLDEWHEFCHWIDSLPYADALIGKRDPLPTEGEVRDFYQAFKKLDERIERYTYDKVRREIHLYDEDRGLIYTVDLDKTTLADALSNSEMFIARYGERIIAKKGA